MVSLYYVKKNQFICPQRLILIRRTTQLRSHHRRLKSNCEPQEYTKSSHLNCRHPPRIGFFSSRDIHFRSVRQTWIIVRTLRNRLYWDLRGTFSQVLFALLLFSHHIYNSVHPAERKHLYSCRSRYIKHFDWMMCINTIGR